MALITDEETKQLSDTMTAMAEEHRMKLFSLRDADNILSAECCCIDENTRAGTKLELRPLQLRHLKKFPTH